jgi:uncharacterized phage-like protein YoqJ
MIEKAIKSLMGKDEETGKQFKDRIKQKIVEILEEDIKCSIIKGE